MHVARISHLQTFVLPFLCGRRELYGGGGVTNLTSETTTVGQHVLFLFLVVTNTTGTWIEVFKGES